MRSLILIILTFAFLGQSSAGEAEPISFPRVKYGQHCNKTTRCNTSSFLTCKNSSCDCTKPEIMTYDPIIQSCLVLVGEKCRYQVSNADNEIGYVPSRFRGFEEVLDCVQNAWCNYSGVCMCTDGYIELSNGTCIPRRIVEESCTSDHECRQDRFLTCINGHCGCNETLSTYNSLLRQCVGKVGQPCIGLDGCVYNADCTSNPVSLPRYGTRRRRMRRQYATMCTCYPGYVSDSTGHCKVGLSGQCSTTKPCADSFKCKDGECVCKYENLQLAMIRTQTCISLVGGPCNETVPGGGTEASNLTSNKFETVPCVDNANCEAINGNATLYECQCNDGFVRNKDGICDLAFGSSCNTGFSNSKNFDDADDDQGPDSGLSWKQDLVCDSTTPLFCVNGICQCESSLYEYDGNGACLGKYGARCKATINMASIAGPGSVNSTATSQCINGAECVTGRESPLPFGKCICSNGFTVISNRTCSNL